MQFRTRPAPCTHCGDTVLIAEPTPVKLLGFRFGRGRTDRGVSGARLEHADPSLDGKVFDGVDEACTRPRVAG